MYICYILPWFVFWDGVETPPQTNIANIIHPIHAIHFPTQLGLPAPKFRVHTFSLGKHRSNGKPQSLPWFYPRRAPLLNGTGFFMGKSEIPEIIGKNVVVEILVVYIYIYICNIYNVSKIDKFPIHLGYKQCCHFQWVWGKRWHIPNWENGKHVQTSALGWDMLVPRTVFSSFEAGKSLNMRV